MVSELQNSWIYEYGDYCWVTDAWFHVRGCHMYKGVVAPLGSYLQHLQICKLTNSWVAQSDGRGTHHSLSCSTTPVFK